MTSPSLDATTVFTVHLRSYGFFHSGREPLAGQVLKRTWEHIPGSTLYGAVAAALLRLDPPLNKETDLNQKTLTVTPDARGRYFDLLRVVQARQIRFTPLIPSAAALQSGAEYCQQAMGLIHQEPTRDNNQAAFSTRFVHSLLHTTPHAPLSRQTEQIHNDQLFAMRTHRSHLDYYGFIFGRSEQRAWLTEAFRFFPFLPVGGKGKFSLVEGELLAEKPLAEFRNELQKWVAARSGWLYLLTPMVFPRKGVAEPFELNKVEEVIMANYQRYRVWRTGLYFNGEGGFDEPLGIGPYYGEEDSPLQAGGAESVAIRAVPEHSRFRLNNTQLQENATRWFIEGTGHAGWSYLGWGQVVIV